MFTAILFHQDARSVNDEAAVALAPRETRNGEE